MRQDRRIEGRGAAALAISVKSYERDLRVAKDPIMLEHVLKDHLAPGDASKLIQAAEKKRRQKDLHEHFEKWVKGKETEIQELDRISKAETDKGLKPADLLVMNYLTKQVMDGWLEALERGTAFTDETAFNFEATLDKKTGKLRVERLNVNTQEESVMNLVKLGSKLTQLGKRVLATAHQKHVIETMMEPQGPQALAVQNPSPYDTDVLKEFGLEDVADQLKKELGAEENAAAEAKEKMEDADDGE